MDLYSQITAVYPELAGMPWLFSDGTISLQNSGSGDFIATWNYSKPQPTQAQLNAAVAPPLSKDDRRAAVLAPLGLTLDTKWQLYSGMAGMLALGALEGKNQAQMYTENTGFRNAFNAHTALTAIDNEA